MFMMSFGAKKNFKNVIINNAHTAALAARNALAVPKSYRIDDFRNAARKRKSPSPEPAGSQLTSRFLTVLF
jgi:hypothetical protein